MITNSHFENEFGGEMMKNLVELEKNHYIQPTSSIQQQQEYGPKIIVEKGDGIFLTDKEGNVFIDAMSSLWNVNVGHGRKELAEVAKQQMEKLAFIYYMKGTQIAIPSLREIIDQEGPENIAAF